MTVKRLFFFLLGTKMFKMSTIAHAHKFVDTKSLTKDFLERGEEWGLFQNKLN